MHVEVAGNKHVLLILKTSQKHIIKQRFIHGPLVLACECTYQVLLEGNLLIRTEKAGKITPEKYFQHAAALHEEPKNSSKNRGQVPKNDSQANDATCPHIASCLSRWKSLG